MRTDRIAAIAASIAAREAGRSTARAAARATAEMLHVEAAAALEVFRQVTRERGAAHLDLIDLGPVEPDDKSVRAFQFRLRRGRHEAVVVSKDRDEVMFVGPFKRGGPEGPCRPSRPGSAGQETADPCGDLETLLLDLIEASFAK